jgi:MSHA biogenesis protein MshQ
MAATFQATGSPQASNGGITVPWPTHLVDDVGFLFIESCGGEAANLSTSNGFAAVGSPQATGATTTGTRLTVYWARATSTTMASPVVSAPGNHAYGVIVSFRGARRTINPFGNVVGTSKATASTTHTMTSIISAIPGSRIIMAVTKDLDATAAFASSWAGTGLTNIVEHFDFGTTSGNGGGIAVASGIALVPGTIGPPSLVVTSSVNASAVINLIPDTFHTVAGIIT